MVPHGQPMYVSQPNFAYQSPVSIVGRFLAACSHMSNSQKVAIFFILVLIDDLHIYVIDVYS